jgi:hypothetical protein
VEKRTAWSTAWGVVGTLFGGGAVAWWVAATPKDSYLAKWPALTFGAVGLVGLYCMFAALLKVWPFRRLEPDPSAGAPRHDGGSVLTTSSPAASSSEVSGLVMRTTETIGPDGSRIRTVEFYSDQVAMQAFRENFPSPRADA